MCVYGKGKETRDYSFHRNKNTSMHKIRFNIQFFLVLKLIKNIEIINVVKIEGILNIMNLGRENSCIYTNIFFPKFILNNWVESLNKRNMSGWCKICFDD